jgi:hypothetical protein
MSINSQVFKTLCAVVTEREASRHASFEFRCRKAYKHIYAYHL